MSEISLIAAYRDKKFAGVLTSRKATVRKGHESVGYQGDGSGDRSATCKCGVVFVSFIAWESHAHELSVVVVGEPPSGQRRDVMLERVLADARERDATGRQRYGVPLTSGNGRDSLVDAYQEQLDLVVYLRAEIDERGLLSGAAGAERIAVRGPDFMFRFMAV